MITGGDYLFDPASGTRYSKDDDHIAQIIELLGEIPKSVAFSGKYSYEFFNRKGVLYPPSFFVTLTYVLLGELRHINKLRYWPLEAVLHDKYLFPKADADALAAFLTPMLRLHPDKRAKACDLIHHNWLEGIVVQGEIDVIRRMEQDEAAKRKALVDAEAATTEGGRTRSKSRDREREREKQRVAALDQSERDAMKPVDDSVLNGDDGDDGPEDEEPQPQHHPAPILNPLPNPPAGASSIAKALQTNAVKTPPQQRKSSAGKQGSTSVSSKKRG